MKKNLLLALFVTGILASCKDPDDKKVVPEGGKGGNAELRITPKHHQKTIDTCMVYIKYNATDTPSGYDDSARCMIIGSDTVAVFSGLKKGQYYLYGRGYDDGIFQTVDGGAPYEITTETVQALNLFVTEDH